MEEKIENYLEEALVKLEKIYDEVLKTQGYNGDTEKLRMLVELTREQVSHEDTRSTTR